MTISKKAILASIGGLLLVSGLFLMPKDSDAAFFTEGNSSFLCLVNSALNPCSTSWSLGTTTSTMWLDANNSNSGTASGSINTPYTGSGALGTAVTNEWSGASAYAYNLAPGTYVQGAPFTFSSKPFFLGCNEATLVFPSGVTFPNSFDNYDCTISGNVHESDNSLTAIHQFNNGVLTGGYVQVDGLALLEGMVLNNGPYFLISTSSLSNIVGTLVQDPIWANGVININDDQISTSTSQFLVTATTTSFTSTGQFGNVSMLGVTAINTGGPGFNINNGATSTFNNISMVNDIVNSTHSLIVGNSKTAVCSDQFQNVLTGAVVLPEASSSAAWVPCESETSITFNQLANGTSSPVADFTAQASSTNATTTVELGKSGQTKGTCIKLYRTDGSAVYAYVAAGATAFTLSTTANICSQVVGF